MLSLLEPAGLWLIVELLCLSVCWFSALDLFWVIVVEAIVKTPLKKAARAVEYRTGDIYIAFAKFYGPIKKVSVIGEAALHSYLKHNK